jgi:hypothetical protein
MTLLKSTTLLLILFIGSNYTQANQTTKNSTQIPFESKQWQLSGNAVIEDYLGKKALKLGAIKKGQMIGIGSAVLQENDFTNGIIEYDVAFDNTPTYAGLKFRIQKSNNHERFYMRAEESGKPDANQYMPVYNDIPSWQLYYGKAYGVPTVYDFNQWIHVKVVVANKLADIYIKDMKTPALTVKLKQAVKAGAVGLWGLNFQKGDAWFANFTLTPMEAPKIKGLVLPEKPMAAGVIPFWSVSEVFDGQLLEGKMTLTEAFKTSIKSQQHTLKYALLDAESTGITNLAQVQKIKAKQDTVFARTIIQSDKKRIKKIEFGFSDRVKVYLNNQLIFSGSDAERSRDFNFLGTVGFYDALYLALKPGDNELLFAVSESVENPNGWAIQAKFNDMQGITLKKK